MIYIDHVTYPHEPGTLYDCAGCENGPCVCDGESFGCVSQDCIHDQIPFELDREELQEEYEYFD